MDVLFAQFRRFVLVGLVNTGIGLSIIWFLMWSGVSAIGANVVGYAVGGTVSFHLNRTWTFQEGKRDALTIGRFLLSFIASYCINILVLTMGLRYTGISPYLIQLIAAGAYSICFFLLSRFFVFRSQTEG